MFKNSLFQGNAGLGQAIAHYTKHGYGVAIPLTDCEDWDLIISKDSNLRKVQVKTGTQQGSNGSEIFEASVKGGNNGRNKTNKIISVQDWDELFLYHIVTGLTAIIPKENIESNGYISFGPLTKYKEFIV